MNPTDCTLVPYCPMLPNRHYGSVLFSQPPTNGLRFTPFGGCWLSPTTIPIEQDVAESSHGQLKSETAIGPKLESSHESTTVCLPVHFESPTRTADSLPSPQPKRIKKGRRRSGEEFRKDERHALANISHQMLTFAATSSRCGYDLERLFPEISYEDKAAYFEFMARTKYQLRGYISEDALLQLWQP